MHNNYAVYVLYNIMLCSQYALCIFGTAKVVTAVQNVKLYIIIYYIICHTLFLKVIISVLRGLCGGNTKTLIRFDREPWVGRYL